MSCVNGEDNNNTNGTEEQKEEEQKPEPEPTKCEKILQIWEAIEPYEYVWGGESKGEGGFDCSGAIYHVQKRIGEPVPRTTSKKYNLLAEGEPKHWEKGSCGDWIWWTFSADRPYGHIGMHIDPVEVWQSGSSTGPTEIKMWEGGYWDGIFEETKTP